MNLRTTATLLLVLCVVTIAHAQSASGAIEGVAVDEGGGVLVGATVTLTHAATGTTRAAVTGSDGLFRALFLPVGLYDVTVVAPGFEPRTESRVAVAVGQTITLRIVLRLAGVAESLKVAAGGGTLETTRTAVSTIVDERAVQHLPVNGRNFIEFALLTAGVARDVRLGDLSFAGQRGTLNSLVIDGADSNNTFAGQTLGRSGSGRAPYQFSLDAVKEFQVNAQSFSAEYGRAGGAVINVVTKSGTNAVRGSTFEFYRDKALNATDAISRLRGLPKAPYHYHQFGGTLGGPLRVDRDFFFANYDGQRNTQPNTVFLDLPADVSADPVTQSAIARLRPLGASWDRRLDQDVFLVKTDHHRGAEHRVSFRYNHQDFTGEGYEAAGALSAWEHTGDSLVKTRTAAATWGWLPGRYLSELRVHYALDHQTGTANSTDPEAAIQERGRRVLVIGRNFFSPRETLLDRAQVAATLAWSGGPHLLKAGFDVQFDKIENYFPGFFSGSYRFASLAAFERRAAAFYRQDFPGPGTSGPYTRPHRDEYSVFVQEEWKPATSVTLNGGLRYDLMRSAAPNVRNAHPELLAADIDTSRLSVDTNNWGPRLGAAWNPRGGRYVLRAGGGLYYGRTPSIAATAAASNGINVVSLTFTGADVPVYPHRFADIPAHVRPQPMIFHVERDHADPKLLHVNTAFEWRIAAATTLTATYLHVTGRDLPRSVDRNLGTAGQRSYTIAGVNGEVTYHRFGPDRPFPSFGRVVAFESSAESRYDGVTVDLSRRARATHVRVAYTLGKVVDTNPDATAVATDDIRFVSNPIDFEVDRTVGDNDRRHRLVASGVYTAAGWSFSSIITTESGRPYSARMIDVDLNNDGNSLNDLAPGTRRNALRLPAIITVDARIARELPLRGRLRAHAIVEAFNLLNRANINGVFPLRYTLQGSTLTPHPSFGLPITSAGERIVQLALRLSV